MQKHRGFALIIVIILEIGCSARMDKPNTPMTLRSGSSTILYTVEDFKIDRDAYKAAFDIDIVKARRLRDAIINRIRLDVEANYRNYESTLFLDRANTNLGADFLELGLAFATTVSNGERVKSVLGAVLSGIKGTRLSYDKNFFREKTVEIIISKMQASRDEVKNRIIQKMSGLPADKYTLEEAMGDLVEFFHAGTLQGGIQALANEAGKAAIDAKDQAEEIDLFRVASEEEVITLEKIRNSYIILRSEWERVRSQAEKSDPLVDKAKAALRALDVSFKPTDSDEAIFDLLNLQIRKVLTDKSQLPKLSKAFVDAKIIE
jgi:hypothetical protein